VNGAQTAYDEAEEACKVAQLAHYQQFVPKQMENLFRMEEERMGTIHCTLQNWSMLEKRVIEFRGKIVDTISDVVDSADLSGDIEDVFSEHMTSTMGSASENDNDGRHGEMPSISVHALLNPIKAGRISKKSDENNTVWKQRYFVLMGDQSDPMDANYQPSSGRLYYFDSEDAQQPRGILDLSVISVHAVDSSLFSGRSCLFALRSNYATTENNELVSKERIIYLSAESQEEQQLWIKALQRYCLCCASCTSIALADPVSLNLDQTENVCINIPQAAPQERTFRSIRSLRISVMEARDLQCLESKDPSENSFNFNLANHTETLLNGIHPGYSRTMTPYCSLGLNGIKVARTTTKTSLNPFWGEDFYFDDISACDKSINLVIQLAGRRRDTSIGWAELNLAQLPQGESRTTTTVGHNVIYKRYEAWLPLSKFGTEEEHHQDTSLATNAGYPAVRVSAVLTEELILPLYEYPSWVNCLFYEDFRVLKMLSKAAERCTTFARDDFARSLVSVLIATDSDVVAFRALLSMEVESTEDPNILFRGSSMATKVIDQYMKHVGIEYLKNTLSGPIRLIYEKASKQDSCEVDPTRIDRSDSEELIKKHQKRLLSYVQLFWDAILNSVDRCPANLRETFHSIRKMVNQNIRKF
jgi:hypothetical protein